MNKFFHILKTIIGVGTTIAAPIVNILFPALSPLVNIILSGIVAAESKFPEKGTGQDKSAYAMAIVAAELPQIIQTIEKATGKELVDEAGLAAGVQKLNDAYVQILNAFKDRVPKVV